jgi:hypothetical protein
MLAVNRSTISRASATACGASTVEDAVLKASAASRSPSAKIERNSSSERAVGRPSRVASIRPTSTREVSAMSTVPPARSRLVSASSGTPNASATRSAEVLAVNRSRAFVRSRR